MPSWNTPHPSRLRLDTFSHKGRRGSAYEGRPTAASPRRTKRITRSPDRAEQHIQARDDQDADNCGGEHARDHRDADRHAARGTGAAAQHQRNRTEDEGDCRHQHGTEAHVAAFDRGFDKALAGFVALLGELDDQDGVLGGQADEQDEADLTVDVEGEAERIDAEDRAEDGDHHRCDDGQGIVQLSYCATRNR